MRTMPKYDKKVEIVNSLSFVVCNDPMVELKVRNYQKKIFFFHPIEGHTNHMVSLAEHLNADVYGLQCTPECKFETIEDYATYYRKLIQQKQSEGPYILCGYSYGAVVALELAFSLEKDGEIVKVISIDGSPQYSKLVLSEMIKDLDFASNIVHQKMLVYFARSFPGITIEQVTILQIRKL